MRYRIFGPKGHVVVRSATAARVKLIRAGLVRRFGRIRVVALKPAPKPRPKAVTMYDAVTVSNIPPYAQAVAGYVNGNWPTFPTLATSHPRAHRLSIDVNAAADADCLDIEQGDASPDQAPGWVRRQQRRGVRRPYVYANRSTMPSVIRALRAAGFKRGDVFLWAADYTYKAHLPVFWWGLRPTRADACQYSDKALGRNLDVSVCAPGFFP